MITISRIVIWPPIAIAFVLLFCVVWQYDQSSTFNYRKMFESPSSIDSDRYWKCDLMELDPWHPTIRQYLDRNSDPQLKCIPTLYKYTDMINGRITIINDTLLTMGNTRYRCLYPHNDYHLIYGDWKLLTRVHQSSHVDCDIVEVDTFNTILNSTTYRYLHTNIYRRSIDKLNDNRYRPNVIIIVIDSTSSSEAIRSLSETMQVLTVDYKAINFRYLNKVGCNSRPNGHAFLTGQRVDAIGKNLYGNDASVPSERPNHCADYLDNSTFISNYFRRNHYTTLMAEDWAKGVFNWPNCSGFRTQPTTHYMRPYQMRTDPDAPDYFNRPLLDQLLTGFCGELYQPVMDYLKQFLRVYPIDTPKWALVWLTELAHNNANGLYHVDGYFADFLTEYRSQLDDAFLIIMGDHGIRFTDIRRTEIGKIEDNNPMFTISVPSRLRTNSQLIENLRNNAQQLISHYDVYATLLDIALFAFESNFTNFEQSNINDRIATVVGHGRGSSLLRPILSSNTRNCETLGIPSQFCICQMNSQTITNATNDATSILMARYMVEQLNQMIYNANVTDQCATLQLNAVENSQIIDYKHKMIYNIRFSVLPSLGHFEAPIMQLNDGSFDLMADKIPRVNRYANQGDCVKYNDLLRPVCYCRNQTTIKSH